MSELLAAFGLLIPICIHACTDTCVYTSGSLWGPQIVFVLVRSPLQSQSKGATEFSKKDFRILQGDSSIPHVLLLVLIVIAYMCTCIHTLITYIYICIYIYIYTYLCIHLFIHDMIYMYLL